MTAGPDAAAPSLSGWLAVFGISYAVLDMAPSFLDSAVGPYLTLGDLVNLVAPLIVIALAWRLYRVIRDELLDADGNRIRRGRSALALSSALYVYGEGMHVAANAVTRHLSPAEVSAAWRVTYFFDEQLSHIVTNAGLAGMSLAMLALAARLRPWPRSPVALLAAALFGFSWFVDGVEGQTVALMLPAAILGLGWIVISGRRGLTGMTVNPVRLFFLAAFAVAVVMFLVWWVWQGGFPEFSQLGWI